MSADYDPEGEAAEATAKLLTAIGFQVDDRTRRLLEVTWMDGYNAALVWVNARVEQASVR